MISKNQKTKGNDKIVTRINPASDLVNAFSLSSFSRFRAAMISDNFFFYNMSICLITPSHFPVVTIKISQQWVEAEKNEINDPMLKKNATEPTDTETACTFAKFIG